MAAAYRADATTDERVPWSNGRVAAGIDIASAALDGVLEHVAERNARQQRSVTP